MAKWRHRAVADPERQSRLFYARMIAGYAIRLSRGGPAEQRLLELRPDVAGRWKSADQWERHDLIDSLDEEELSEIARALGDGGLGGPLRHALAELEPSA